jgi:hypothetical protein
MKGTKKMTVNSHINVSRIPVITAKQYNVVGYDESVKFANWLNAQTTRFATVEDALKAWNGQTVEAPQVAETPKQYKESDFRSRQELNNFLRRNGYTWSKVATFGEYEESRYGESGRWQLYSSDDRAVTVAEALKEIGR